MVKDHTFALFNFGTIPQVYSLIQQVYCYSHLIYHHCRRGATLVLACRSFERTRETIKEIRTETGNNDVHYMHLDLASLVSVRAFVEEVLAAHPAVHTLVCNAGVWVPMEDKAKTQEGFEVGNNVAILWHWTRQLQGSLF